MGEGRRGIHRVAQMLKMSGTEVQHSQDNHHSGGCCQGGKQLPPLALMCQLHRLLRAQLAHLAEHVLPHALSEYQRRKAGFQRMDDVVIHR